MLSLLSQPTMPGRSTGDRLHACKSPARKRTAGYVVCMWLVRLETLRRLNFPCVLQNVIVVDVLAVTVIH